MKKQIVPRAEGVRRSEAQSREVTYVRMDPGCLLNGLESLVC